MNASCRSRERPANARFPVAGLKDAGLHVVRAWLPLTSFLSTVSGCGQSPAIPRRLSPASVSTAASVQATTSLAAHAVRCGWPRPPVMAPARYCDCCRRSLSPSWPHGRCSLRHRSRGELQRRPAPCELQALLHQQRPRGDPPMSGPSPLSSPSITIATINVNGWARKGPLLHHLALTENVAVLAVQDTRRASWHRPPRIPGYQAFHQSWRGRGSNTHGASLFVRSRWPAEHFTAPSVSEGSDIVACVVRTHSRGQVIFACLYCGSGRPFPTDVLAWAAQTPRCVLMGYFNARHTDFGDSYTNNNGAALIDALVNSNLHRLPGDLPTFVGAASQAGSFLDHIIVSSDLATQFYGEAHVGDTVTSDHLPLLARTVLFGTLPTPDGAASGLPRYHWRAAN